MAAATDLFQEVGLPGTATTLSAPGYTLGNTSITVGSTSNWPTATGVTFAIDRAEVINGVEVRIEGTYCEFVGKVDSGTQITEVSKEFGPDQDYSAGALTRVYIPVSSERENRLVQGLLVSHNQDGSIKMPTASKVTASASDKVLIDDGASKYTTVSGLATSVAANVPNGGMSTKALTNPYKFRVYRNAAFSLPGGSPPVNTKIPYDSETYDTGSNFDTTTNRRFTATEAGFYVFTARLLILGTADNGKIILYKNGVEHSHGNNNAASNFFGSTVSDMIQLAIGDYVEVFYRSSTTSTSPIEVGSAVCYFTGYLESQS